MLGARVDSKGETDRDGEVGGLPNVTSDVDCRADPAGSEARVGYRGIARNGAARMSGSGLGDAGAFCEVDKYSRVFHPEIAGISLRTRIKQKFRASAETLDLWYPPKWGINGEIAASRKEISDGLSGVSA